MPSFRRCHVIVTTTKLSAHFHQAEAVVVVVTAVFGTKYSPCIVIRARLLPSHIPQG